MKHPGETLSEFLQSKGLTQADLARMLNTKPGKISEIINGKWNISPTFALQLEDLFKSPTAEDWLTIQMQYDLSIARSKFNKER